MDSANTSTGRSTRSGRAAFRCPQSPRLRPVRRSPGATNARARGNTRSSSSLSQIKSAMNGSTSAGDARPRWTISSHAACDRSMPMSPTLAGHRDRPASLGPPDRRTQGRISRGGLRRDRILKPRNHRARIGWLIDGTRIVELPATRAPHRINVRPRFHEFMVRRDFRPAFLIFVVWHRLAGDLVHLVDQLEHPCRRRWWNVLRQRWRICDRFQIRVALSVHFGAVCEYAASRREPQVSHHRSQ